MSPDPQDDHQAWAEPNGEEPPAAEQQRVDLSAAFCRFVYGDQDDEL